MTSAPKSAYDLTSHTLRDVPEELWDRWSNLIPRKYSRLGDAIMELIAADLRCREKHGHGAVELLVDDGAVERDAINELLTDAPNEAEGDE